MLGVLEVGAALAPSQWASFSLFSSAPFDRIAEINFHIDADDDSVSSWAGCVWASLSVSVGGATLRPLSCDLPCPQRCSAPPMRPPGHAAGRLGLQCHQLAGNTQISLSLPPHEESACATQGECSLGRMLFPGTASVRAGGRLGTERGEDAQHPTMPSLCSVHMLPHQRLGAAAGD